MQNQYPIGDVYVFPVQRSEGRWKLLSDSDHLLRRFGQLEFLSLKEQQSANYEAREEADEICFVLRGKMTVKLTDLREDSPSYNAIIEIALRADEPKGLLIPFGVAYSLVTSNGVDLLKVSTHQQVAIEAGSG
jgi:hypothetical protein